MSRPAARSLRLRLLAGAMAAVAVALAVAWLGLTVLFERRIERREAADLTGVGELLIAGLSLEAQGAPVADPPPADPRFARLAGGRYWQVAAPRGVLASRSLWDQSLPRAADVPADGWRTRFAAGPFRERLFIVERTVRLDPGGPPLVVQVAQDEAGLRTARHEFGRELGLSLVLLWLFLSGAAWLQVDLGLRPLTGLRVELERLRASPHARLEGAWPREVEPLTSAINGLAEAREGDLLRARQRAADLAHSLKSPLAALAAQTRRAREAGAGEAAEGLERAIAAMAAAVEAELARSRAAAARGAVQASSAPSSVVERLVAVLERTEAGERLDFEVSAPADLRAPMAQEDLAEALGALLENAARHARARVCVSGDLGPDGARLVIEDDGPGIDDLRAPAALARGGRLDEAGVGDGLGLAIAADLIAASGGTLELGRAALGGLRVAILWPG